MDVRDADSCEAAVKATVDRFGSLDILINNASAISLTPTSATSVKKYDLMNGVNGRGTWVLSRAALPHLVKSRSPIGGHILAISPPLRDNIVAASFGGQTACASLACPAQLTCSDAIAKVR